MSDYCYNQYIGPETLDKEYKLFTLHFLGTNLDPHNESYCEELIRTGKWIFNKSVIENMEYYIEYYLPKYTSSFLQDSFEMDQSEMFFGVSNEGFVQGIPYQGELDIEKIKEKVNEVLSSDLIKTNNNQELNNLVTVELIKVNTTEFKLKDDQLKFMEEYFNSKKDYFAQINLYRKRKKIWYNLMVYYSDKLTILLNNVDTRKLILDYVIEKDPTRFDIINQLKSDKKFKPITGDEIQVLKLDKNTIWHWVTEWKDYITDHIKFYKPETPPYTQRIFPINILITMVDMIPQWLDKDNINLYLIKFSFRKSKLNNFNIKYKVDSEYYSCYRLLNDFEEPISQLL